jgi:hypothetical protein
MSQWKQDIETALGDFIEVCKLAGAIVKSDDISAIFSPAPHAPTGLPKGMMAAYGFYHDKRWLKIGIVGPNSNARFRSQHYLPHSSKSNLAQSLLKDSSTSSFIEVHMVGEWIKANCHRMNILLRDSLDLSLLRLLEAFLHARLKPRYER